jgi:hypothetical protein
MLKFGNCKRNADQLCTMSGNHRNMHSLHHAPCMNHESALAQHLPLYRHHNLLFRMAYLQASALWVLLC